MARGRVETFTGYFPALRYVKITCSLLRRKSGILPPKSGRMWVPTSKRVSELQQLFLPSLLPRRVYQSHGYTRVSNLQAASACTQPFGGRCVERCIIRHSRTIRGWYAQTYTGSTANGSGTNFRWCGRVGLAGALLGQTPAACWNLQILIHLYKKDDRSIFSMLLSSLDCLCAPGGDDLVVLS